MPRNLLSAEQTARRLGVKLETVYAYVSRGVLNRTLSHDGRASRFDSKEVDELAARGRPRRGARRTGNVEVTLATAITGIQDDRLLYRGYDATALARQASFEAVAELLWTGALPERRPSWPAPEHKPLRPIKTAGPLDCLALTTAALAPQYPLRVDLQPSRVAEHARLLLTAFPPSLPLAATSERKERSNGLAAQLFQRLSPLPATSARIQLLDAALVLMADHELATSTLAARVAASTRADPFAVVLAGLGALSGPLHGRAAARVQTMIADASASSAEAAIARLLGASERIPGFGHPVYRGIDPRAAFLLKELYAVLKSSDCALLERLAAEGTRSSTRQPNVDFALGALAFALEMRPGSTEAVMAVARTAGWIAHAIEEYGEAPLRFRARSIYVGARAHE
ncbi:MAG TPA: citrate/2-methylcitrate synthase [Polyangiaceae bacterium]|nr:citrate/2-methylcitrate synthase [Polyangiaceae bacterium]